MPSKKKEPIVERARRDIEAAKKDPLAAAAVVFALLAGAVAAVWWKSQPEPTTVAPVMNQNQYIFNHDRDQSLNGGQTDLGGNSTSAKASSRKNTDVVKEKRNVNGHEDIQHQKTKTRELSPVKYSEDAMPVKNVTPTAPYSAQTQNPSSESNINGDFGFSSAPPAERQLEVYETPTPANSRTPMERSPQVTSLPPDTSKTPREDRKGAMTTITVSSAACPYYTPFGQGEIEKAAADRWGRDPLPVRVAVTAGYRYITGEGPGLEVRAYARYHICDTGECKAPQLSCNKMCSFSQSTTADDNRKWALGLLVQAIKKDIKMQTYNYNQSYIGEMPCPQ